MNSLLQSDVLCKCGHSGSHHIMLAPHQCANDIKYFESYGQSYWKNSGCQCKSFEPVNGNDILKEML